MEAILATLTSMPVIKIVISPFINP